MENHIPNDLKKYRCSICQKGFMTKLRLKYHMRLRHCTENDKNIACTQCDKKYKFNVLFFHFFILNLLKHFYVFMFRFLLQSMLTLHIKNVHDLSRSQICDICAKSFKNKYSLATHQNEVHGRKPSDKKICQLCGSVLVTKNLQRIFVEIY